ncbi:MAG: GTPase Era [Rickettsiales bacterium]|jgi:GTP-binding protein Era|nr:GTPase Era [Rickettsiales bacterium]
MKGLGAKSILGERALGATERRTGAYKNVREDSSTGATTRAPDKIGNRTESKAGFVALIGATNSGKSTLVNAMMGEHLSITSHKVQTTRFQVRGVKNIGGTQIVFVDTPGVFAAKSRFDRAMVSSALSAMNDSDAVVVVVDAKKGLTPTFARMVEKLRTVRSPIAVALNKTDAVKKTELLGLAKEISDAAPGLFEETFMISALRGDGVDALLAWAKSKMPESEWYFGAGEASDLPLPVRLAEITREKVYEYLHQELPYSIAVATDSVDGANVGQTIYASGENHKSMILGARGSKIKAIGTAARIDMERLLGRRINLRLLVKVKKDWRETPEFFRSIGLEYKK